jgi:methionine S-methyltransferase
MKKLTMMEIPSIFIPEDWSFTFYEGLNRHPDSIFRDKTVAELGCGNGWISIALAEKWCPSKVDLSFPAHFCCIVYTQFLIANIS